MLIFWAVMQCGLADRYQHLKKQNMGMLRLNKGVKCISIWNHVMKGNASDYEMMSS
jgi:hypothetical protein